MTLKATLIYDTRLSKNKNVLHHKTGYQAAKRDAMLQILDSANKQRAKFTDKTPTKISITVFAPDYRTDPHNFIDSVLDAASAAIKVNDRWFDHVSCDGMIAEKGKERIEIVILQE